MNGVDDNTEAAGETLHEANARHHWEAVGDGGATYFAFHGWLLECFSCGWEARGTTKEQAMRHMQDHYNAVTVHTEYRVEVQARGREF